METKITKYSNSNLKIQLDKIHFYSSLTDVKFGPKVGQISVHFGSLRQMYCNLNWKSPGLVPFSVNLTHFGANLISLYHIDMAVLNDENLDTLFIIQIFLYLVQDFFSNTDQDPHSSKTWSLDRLSRFLAAWNVYR